MNRKDIDDLSEIPPLEKLKLKMDYDSMTIERHKMWVTAIAIFIPLLLGVGTIFYGKWLENIRAISGFEIKAVEIVMNASSPKAATNKAMVLSELFPDRLPKGFKEKMLTMYGKPQQEPERK